MVLTALIVLAAGQPDPAAPGNTQPGFPVPAGVFVVILIIAIVFLINWGQEKSKK